LRENVKIGDEKTEDISKEKGRKGKITGKRKSKEKINMK
jgi:hypothetical protein